MRARLSPAQRLKQAGVKWAIITRREIRAQLASGAIRGNSNTRMMLDTIERAYEAGRFTNLPARLRQQSEMVSEGLQLELGDALAIAGTMRDAALKIEALERDLEARKAWAKLGRR